MKFKLFFLLILACSCDKSKPNHTAIALSQVTERQFVAKTNLNLVFRNDTVFFKSEKYEGVIFDINPSTTDTLEITEYANGVLHGISKKWYSKTQLMEERHYQQGQKHGKQVVYWENGNKKFEFTAKNDMYEGELKEWTSDGKLIHLANFVNGQEEGAQKLWYDNGKIRANYVIIKGKRYGLLGTKNCKNVSDSIFIIK